MDNTSTEIHQQVIKRISERYNHHGALVRCRPRHRARIQSHSEQIGLVAFIAQHEPHQLTNEMILAFRTILANRNIFFCFGCCLIKKNTEFETRPNQPGWRAAWCRPCMGYPPDGPIADEGGRLNPDYKIRHSRKNALLAAAVARRQAAKIQATPQWADQLSIQLIYQRAITKSLETGIVHHVDHIVPLRSSVVCGLHVSANLQILTGTENIKKSNRWTPAWAVSQKD